MPKYHINYLFKGGKQFNNSIIYQVGRFISDNKLCFDSHIQRDFYELTIVTNGKGVISTNDVPTIVNEGDIYISFPSDIHKLESFNDSVFEYDFITFKPIDNKLSNIYNKINLLHYEPTKRVFNDNKISYLVNNLLSEFEKESSYYEDVINNIMSEISIYIIRDLYTKEKIDNLFHNQNNSTMLCYQIMNYIDTNIYSITNLESITKTINYNYSYLSNLFKKTTGKTITKYYVDKKLFIAKQLLIENVSPTKISEILKYDSYFSFSRLFKNKYGLSPKNYRKNFYKE